MTTRKKPPAVIEPWQETDWSSNGPYGAAVLLKQPQPCAACRKPAYLLSPRKKVSMHKHCADQAILIVYLCRILTALGDGR